MFNRIIIQELKQWRAKKDRKPLIMLGARQVGKTSVLQKFGEEYFEHCAYFSLDEEEGVCDIFRKTKNPRTSVTGRSLIEYNKRYSPGLRIRYSMLNLKRDDSFINIPLFLADRTEKLIFK